MFLTYDDQLQTIDLNAMEGYFFTSKRGWATCEDRAELDLSKRVSVNRGVSNTSPYTY
jgi:hypothetical protein